MKAILALLATVVGAWLIINLIGALIVGLIARRIFPAKDRIGWPTTILVGFLGGIVGKIIFRILGWSTGIFMGFIAAICGAFLLLLVHHLMVANRAKSAPAPPAA